MSAPWIVAKVCRAEDLMQEAARLLVDARIDLGRVAKGEDPASEDAQVRLRGVSERLEALRGELGPLVRETAALIRDPD